MRAGQQVPEVHLRIRNQALDSEIIVYIALRVSTMRGIQRLMLVDAGMHPELCVQPDDDPQRSHFDRSAGRDLNALQTGEVVGDEAGRPRHCAGCHKAA